MSDYKNNNAAYKQTFDEIKPYGAFFLRFMNTKLPFYKNGT